ncbi:Calcium-independent phospholipase A2-gamma [Rhizoctonia solani]|uniref:Calcium-independent phospholipase A2-gamma n=1 Tax=Rhizoctonia solani TaxID=456999 RepID=A0A0K6G8X9_9AGAM|nr:Calcium-independent phospholipase A2-gamma [Rhizoctonia solani]
MGRVKRDEGLPEIPRPCDYFDIIGGTSTGGLIAIMLGRLRMSISEAIEAYVELSDQIFSEHKHRWQDGRFKASLLEKAIKKIVSDHSSSDGEARMFDPLLQNNPQPKGCRAFVCALSRDNMEGKLPVHFRTYQSEWNPMPNCKIWEAARATSAAPTFFKSITISDGGIPSTFVDGGLAVNNPTVRVLLEAKDVFPDSPVSCILSIGTGQAKTISMSKTSAVSNAIVPDLQLAGAVKKIATDCEKVADEMAGRFVKYPGVYFRFNVDQGMQDIGLGAFEKLSELAAHTSAYMRLHENDMRANSAASALKSTRQWGPVSIDEIAY